jgi:hypothetical protein
MEFMEVDVPQDATEVNVCFARGSDAITEYDIFLFLVTPDRNLFRTLSTIPYSHSFF